VIRESWMIGVLEYWNAGRKKEWWVVEILGKDQR
jgi:hypothetical protein